MEEIKGKVKERKQKEMQFNREWETYGSELQREKDTEGQRGEQ